MIIHGSTPPFRPLPQSLRDRSTRSLQNVRNQNCDSPFLDLKTTERKRPKSSPLKMTPNLSKEFKSKEDWQKESKGSIRAVRGAFDDKGTMYFKVIQPGYVIAKRRSGISVTLNMDELYAGAPKDCKKSPPIQDERELKIKKLQREIEDLKATLAEERISNRSQFQQFVENTKIDVEVMIQEHRDHIKTIEEEHEIELENFKAMYEAKINEEKEEANLREIQMQEEIDSIKETLQSCTEDVTAELEQQWLHRKEELNAEQEQKTEQLVKQQRLKLKSERIAALSDMMERHSREIDDIKEAHSKAMNALHAEYTAFVADAENLKIIVIEAEKLREDFKDLQDVHDKTKEKLRKTKNELADAKVQLQGYELSFSEKVAEVEERYSMKIQGLMLDNRDIRRNYMRKCAALLDVQNNDSSKERKSSNTKSTMKTIILARAKADVSLISEKHKKKMDSGSPKRAVSPLRRPQSAPLFKPEVFEDDNMFLTISELRTYRPNSSLA